MKSTKIFLIFMALIVISNSIFLKRPGWWSRFFGSDCLKDKKKDKTKYIQERIDAIKKEIPLFKTIINNNVDVEYNKKLLANCENSLKKYQNRLEELAKN